MILTAPTIFTLGSLLLGLGVEGSTEKRIGGVLAGAPVNNITVKADNVVQCSQATISWSGTSSGPVSLSIGQGGYYVGQTTLETHEGITDSSYTWTVTQSEGTSLIFELQDSSGQRNYVQNVKVSGSPDTSCLADTSASASSAAASSSASAVGESASVVQGTSTSSWSEPSSSAAQEGAPSSSSSKSKSATSSQSASTAAAASSTTVPTPATTISLTSTGSGSASGSGSTSNAPSVVPASSSGVTAPLAAASGGASSGSNSQLSINPLGLTLGGVITMLAGWLI
ncbi:hypothetical protein I302_104980 [Kwoniella bestiolae CBS 10118]|uniref:Uncharacterized protein n=1 Tax=Kwoniella bestiolae CBS 10118 TaxID=1296100 RepID=A0A1B9FR90_9TREE|nr:hypothetical protein I302_08948 [Kwoniella bestiolae CBS 10118]OCF21276.1 hypothetical protein I302_08948 [Kwoniella bestiolae CBS 10118]